MAIRRRGEKWQADFFTKGIRYRKAFSTKEEATVWEAMARQAVALGKAVPEGQVSDNYRTTLVAASDRCYDLHWRDGKSDAKQVIYINQLLGYFGKHKPIEDITTDKIDDYILDLKRLGNSNGTINRKLSALQKILRTAHKANKLTALPHFNRQREGKNRIRWLTKDEEQAITTTMEQWGYTDLLDAFIVSIDTGLRAGELVKIEARDMTDDGLYLGETKNGYPRTVPLTSRSRRLLEARKEMHKGRLFPYENYWYRSVWERVLNHLELEDVVWHTLRHTTCSRLVQGGVPLTHVKEWMGHRTIITTQRYAHLAPKHLNEAVNVLE
jgi:integrase